MTSRINPSLVHVQGLSKKFCRSFKRSLLYGALDIGGTYFPLGERARGLRRGEFWALKDVSFELRRGQSIGLIGANGSGKTTLLRLISGILKPNSGRITVHGKIAPLIALGTGFNPILTGRENIHINLSILGATRSEIRKRLDRIIDFSEIGEAIDVPLKTYSSGMWARLAFACALEADPDLLLVDEVLAVGDMKFRLKCYQKLASLKEQGVSLILVSHSSHSILANCHEVIYLRKGEPAFLGPVDAGLEKYELDVAEEMSRATTTEVNFPALSTGAFEGKAGLGIRGVRFEDSGRRPIEILGSGEAAYLVVDCEATSSLRRLSLGVIVRDYALGEKKVLFMESGRDGFHFDVNPGRFQLRLEWPVCGLRPGYYSAKIYVTAGDYINLLDCVESFPFRVRPNALLLENAYYQPRKWGMAV